MNDKDCDYQRKSDVLLAEISTRFNDFLERYESDQRTAKEWRTEFQTKIADIDDRIEPLSLVNKVSIWIFTITGGALIYEVVKRVFEFFKGHIHFN